MTKTDQSEMKALGDIQKYNIEAMIAHIVDVKTIKVIFRIRNCTKKKDARQFCLLFIHFVVFVGSKTKKYATRVFKCVCMMFHIVD